MNSFLNTLPSQVRGAWSDSFGGIELPTFKKWGLSVHDHIIPHSRNNYHPHLLSHRFIALVSILAIAVKIASVSLIAFSPAATTLASAITTETVVSLTNQARVQNSLPELKVSGLLTRAAQNKANDMLAKQYFAHNSPDGATPWSFIKATGYSYTTAGENLAIDFQEAESVQAAWMNSPGHRANILNGKFQEFGIGIVKGTYDNHQTTIVVQMFGAPIAQQVAVSEQPTQVAPKSQPSVPQAAPASPSAVAPQSAPQSIIPEVTGSAAEVPVIQSQPIQFMDTKTSLQENNLYLEVTSSSNVTKILAFYGNKSVMLDPIGNNIWQTTIPISNIGKYDNLILQGQDLTGNLHQEPVAQFSNGLLSNSSLGEVNGESITVFGAEINPRVWEEKVFLIILAAIIASLIIAIGIKRHIQHLSLIANTSFAAVLIGMLMLI